VEMSIIQAMNKTTHLRFNYDNTIFVTRVINEKFPPYEIVIQQNPEFTAYFVKPEILGAIRRVAILSNFTSKQIRFFLDKEILKIHGHDEDTGSQGDETVNVSFNGSYTEFCFNYKFLDEAIQNIDLSDPEQKVYMTYTDPTRPIIIKSDCKGDDLMMLIMPIKLSS